MYSQYKKLLAEYVSYKSVSTDLSYSSEMKKTVEWLSKLLKKNGFSVEILQGPKTNPVLLATYTISKEFETVLIYGHYDVQPGEKEDGWKSDPFVLAERAGRLYARGAVDNKGQNLIHIVSVLSLIKEGKLSYNVKFLLEGNEETGNADMSLLLKNNKNKLKADHILISDGEIVGKNPTIEASLRGGFNMKVTYTTAPNNLHSGLCGGAIPNSTNELAKLLAKIYTSKNKIAIPGFYDGADIVSKSQKENIARICSPEEVKKLYGVKKLVCEDGLDFFTQTGLRPTIQITGLKSGYISEGYANIVPSSAEVRLNIRLVSSQKAKEIYKKVKDFIISETPDYVSVKIELDHLSDPVKIDVDSPKMREVRSLLKKHYGLEPIVKYVGGGIPIVKDFQDILGLDTMLVSLGNDDCNMHGVNENFKVDLVKKGLEFSAAFFSRTK